MTVSTYVGAWNLTGALVTAPRQYDIICNVEIEAIPAVTNKYLHIYPTRWNPTCITAAWTRQCPHNWHQVTYVASLIRMAIHRNDSHAWTYTCDIPTQHTPKRKTQEYICAKRLLHQTGNKMHLNCDQVHIRKNSMYNQNVTVVYYANQLSKHTLNPNMT